MRGIGTVLAGIGALVLLVRGAVILPGIFSGTYVETGSIGFAVLAVVVIVLVSYAIWWAHSPE